MLQAVNISKTFPGAKALDGVNMTFQKGKVTAILGENGAEKSTLLKILSGIYQDYEGEILIDNTVHKFENISASQSAGIAIIHQELNLISDLSITENLFLGNEISNVWGVLYKTKMQQLCLPLKKQQNPDVSALGAAYLAGLKSGVYESIEQLKQFNKAKTEEILPDLANNLIKRSYEGWKVLINK